MSFLLQALVPIPYLVPIITGSVLPVWMETDTLTYHELHTTAFYEMDDVPKTFDTLFWNLQTEFLLKYNGITNKTWSDSYTGVKFINYPLIYPEISWYLPLNLSWIEELVKFSTYEKCYLEKENNVILILRDDKERVILGYYEDQELRLATYVSIWWKKSKTKGWIYRIVHNLKDRRSWLNKREPMPYALQYDWDYFMHWWDTSEVENSHGCIRVPWLYIKRLYEHVPENKKTVIIIHKPYQISLEKNK